MINHINEDKKALKSMIILFKAHKSLVEFIKEDIKETTFDINEFAVFEVIYHKKKIKVSDIKEKVLMANSSLSYILNKLTNKNLIKRENDIEDKRISYISLTKKGEKEALKIFPKHYDNLKKVFNCLRDDEEEQLNNLLKKIGKKAEGI